MKSGFRNILVLLMASTIAIFCLDLCVVAEEDFGRTVQLMTRRISELEDEVRILTDWQSREAVIFAISLLTICATICGIWAQNSRRNAILWFTFGFCVIILALPLVLFLNWRDKASKTAID